MLISKVCYRYSYPDEVPYKFVKKYGKASFKYVPILYNNGYIGMLLWYFLYSSIAVSNFYKDSL